jgi:hypothetical protein
LMIFSLRKRRTGCGLAMLTGPKPMKAKRQG